MSTFPTSIDTFPTIVSGALRASIGPESAQFNKITSAVVALEEYQAAVIVPPSGDLTGATDLAALNAAWAAGGKVVLTGTATTPYWVNGLLVAAPNLDVEGAGNGVTIIRQVANTGAFRIIRNQGFAFGGTDTNIRLRKFTVDGNSAQQTAPSIGVNFQGVSGVTLDIDVKNCAAQGVYLGGCRHVELNLDTHDHGLDGINLGILQSTSNVLTITGVTNSGTTVTVTVASTTTLEVGEPVFIAGIAGFTTNNPNSQTVVATIPNATTFTYIYQNTGAPTGSYSSGGTVTPVVLCSDVHGYVRTSNCGQQAVTTVGSASNGAVLPQATITAATTIPQGTTVGTFNPAGGTFNVYAYAPISNIPLQYLVTYTGITGATFTGCSGGTGTMAAGQFIGTPTAPGATFDGCTDFDVTVHSFNAGYHGIAASGGGTTRGRLSGTSVGSGRYGCYVGIGPTEIRTDITTSGSGFGGQAGEYGTPAADVWLAGISDGDAYGFFVDTCDGYQMDGVVRNAQKHGMVLSGSSHCAVNLRHGYNNGLLTNNTYSDVLVSGNAAFASGHPTSPSTYNDVTVAVSEANAANKVFAVVDIVDVNQIRNRVSVGAIDGAPNSIQISGQAASNTRNFALPSGGVDPLGFFNLGASMTGAVALDARNGSTMGGTLTGNVTLTTLGGNSVGDRLTLIFTQNATGNFTVTFSGANWRIGSYAMTATALKRDILNLVWDGTVWNLAAATQAL